MATVRWRGNIMLNAAVAAVAAVAADAVAQADAVLTVRTQPEGVEVWLADKYLGDSPIADRHVTPGRYTLRLVSAPLRVSQTEEIFLQAGEHKVIERTLGVKYGSLRVETVPPGAQVSIGAGLGTTPLENDLITPGKYRLEIRPPNPRHVGTVEEITVMPGETVRVERTLERRNPFTTKALVRILLGVGAMAGFTWAIVEQDIYRSNWEKSKTVAADRRESYLDKSRSAATWRTVGVALGGACVLAFEIVAFF